MSQRCESALTHATSLVFRVHQESEFVATFGTHSVFARLPRVLHFPFSCQVDGGVFLLDVLFARRESPQYKNRIASSDRGRLNEEGATTKITVIKIVIETLHPKEVGPKE